MKDNSKKDSKKVLVSKHMEMGILMKENSRGILRKEEENIYM